MPDWVGELNKVGVFNALVKFVENGELSKEEGAKMHAHTFAFYAEKVREAQTEVRRIDAVLGRMASLCATGKQVTPWKGKGPLVDKLASEARALDGWVISLYETDLTMIRFAAPELGKARPNEMAKSMDALWEKRMAAVNLRLKGTGEFKLLF